METLDRHFRALTGASFAKRGRGAADLMTQWPAIVGEALAAICVPERIRWPRAAGADAPGGILVIRSAPGHALDLHYQSALIVERINAFLGYQAVASIKVTQGHKALGPASRAAPEPLPPETAEALEAKLAAIADERLREALARLGRGALGKPRVSPQAK
jgi:hypothetical protein